ncbi:Zinc finger protein 76 [Frankliniella fusca]|uniref:Zinc finger protein 76 n=1 Tax=Frankliniella fusca TaxID=407009 RepID=A0AAE1GUD6_9NEOP|nr:Zinc finger protein 76 [Frankliniella fusca]
MAYLCKSQRALSSHERFHSRIISCPVASCALKFSTEASRDVHISREHKSSKRCLEPTVDFKCPVNTCKEHIKTRADYLKHMPDHLAEGSNFVCGYPECKHKSAGVNNFRVHMSTQHPKKRKVESSSTSKEPLSSAVSDDPTSSSNADSFSFSQVNEDNSKTDLPKDSQKEEQFSDQKIKDEYAKFYLRLESEFILPSTTVQVIAERIQRTTELSHHCLKRQLRAELEAAGLDETEINSMISKVFKSDPIFNIHHKYKDFDNLTTHHMRQKYWKEHFPYVEPKQVFLGTDAQGKKKYSHYFPIKDSLTQLLKDPTIKEMVLQSFNIIPQDPKTFTSSKIFSDYTDGSEFAEHI